MTTVYELQIGSLQALYCFSSSVPVPTARIEGAQFIQKLQSVYDTDSARIITNLNRLAGHEHTLFGVPRAVQSLLPQNKNDLKSHRGINNEYT